MANMMDKYGVPLPSGRTRPMSQPKVKNKFRVIMSNFGTDKDDTDYIAMNVDSVDRPGVEFQAQTVKLFATDTTYLGRWDWKPITLVIRDSVDNKSAKAVAKQLQKQLDFQRRISAKAEQNYVGYKFRMMIETTGGANPDDTMAIFARETATDVADALTNNTPLVNAVDQIIGGEGYNSMSTLDRYVCYGCIVTDFEYDTLDYGSSQYVTIKLTIKPDNVVQYDNIEEMYGTKINSLLPDSVDSVLDVIDKIYRP